MPQKKKTSDFKPGILQWLDPQRKTSGQRAAKTFLEKQTSTVEFVTKLENVDMCDTHMNQSAVIELYCLLSGIKDPVTSTNALTSQFCPETVQHLADAAEKCKDEPGLCA